MRVFSKLETGIPDVHVVSIPRPAGEELILTLPQDDFTTKRRAHEFLTRLRANVIAEEGFGLPNAPAPDWPALNVGGESSPSPLRGSLLWATTAPVERIEHENRVVGTVYSDGEVRICRLAGLTAPNPRAGRPEQARAVLESMELLLKHVGMSFSDVIRTWFYNDDILAWYGEFNRVRNAFFKERKVFDGLVPASTGIGGSNPAGTALTTGLLAYRPLAAGVSAAALPSPLQCPALEYGSSFSRAVELVTPGLRRITVSGTASIEPGGKTAHLGDVTAQIDLTMRVVRAILEQRGAGWSDVVRGMAYLRQSGDVGAWRAWAHTHGATAMPIVVTHNVVCRDDLLFELELDALVAP